MKNLIKILTITLLCACGGYDSEHIDLGQYEQPYSARVTTNYQFGSQTATAHKQCDRVSSGQVCSVPAFKTIEVGGDASLTIGNLLEMSTVINRLDAATNFDVHAVSIGNPPAPNTVRLILSVGAVSGTLSSNIEGYSSVTFVSTTGLTEGVADADPVGQYQKHGACTGKLDTTDINNKGTNATEDINLFRHAVGHAIEACMGLGSRDDAGANAVYSRRTVIPGTDLGGMTAGETCRANSYSTTNNGDFSNQGVGGLCATVD